MFAKQKYSFYLYIIIQVLVYIKASNYDLSFYVNIKLLELTTEEVIKSMKEESFENISKAKPAIEKQKWSQDTGSKNQSQKQKGDSFISSILRKDSEGKTIIPLPDKSMEVLKDISSTTSIESYVMDLYK